MNIDLTSGGNLVVKFIMWAAAILVLAAVASYGWHIGDWFWARS